MRASNKKASVYVLLVVLWTLNGLNRQRIMKDLGAAVSGTYQAHAPSPDPASRTADRPAPAPRTEDTAVIITSSWIPSHPSTHLLETVLNSTARLRGLSPTAPIVITVDHFRPGDLADAAAVAPRLAALEQYTENLYSLYLDDPRIHVVPAMKHLHIGGSLVKAMRLLRARYPSVEYVHYLQHDFFFFKDTDHAALIAAMREHDEINYVRFIKPHAGLHPSCGDHPPIRYNSTLDPASNDTRVGTLTLTPTLSYSDNNHLVRLKWNLAAIGSLVKLNRTPENPLQKRAFNGCAGHGRFDDIHGLYLYHEVNIGHLDGRHRAATP